MAEQATPGTVEAHAPFAAGNVQLIRRCWDGAIDTVGTPHMHRLELATLRFERARGCFPDRWGPNRFERFGQLFLLPAHQLVHAKSECLTQYSIVCSFAPHALETWAEQSLEWTDARLQAGLDIASPALRSLLLRLGEEVRAPGLASASMIDLLAGQIAIELARFCFGVEPARPRGGLSAWRLRLIDERLEQAGPAPTLSELAALCGLSTRQLTRAFRASRGRSIGAAIVESRIDHARRRLAAGDSIKAVAFAAGFNSSANFCAAFRRAAGETAGAYRARALRRWAH